MGWVMFKYDERDLNIMKQQTSPPSTNFINSNPKSKNHKLCFSHTPNRFNSNYHQLRHSKMSPNTQSKYRVPLSIDKWKRRFLFTFSLNDPYMVSYVFRVQSISAIYSQHKMLIMIFWKGFRFHSSWFVGAAFSICWCHQLTRKWSATAELLRKVMEN